MEHHSVRYTLAIFRRLFQSLPPLVPRERRDDMKQALEQMEHNMSLSLDELEDTMIVFGKQVWPYRRAYQEFYDLYDGRLGEQMLRQALFPAMKKKYDLFLAHGGSYRDLHGGGPLGFFESEERMALCEALVEVRQTLREYVSQAVVTEEREEYQARIYEFHEILDDMEARLATLRTMADNEQEHPELAAEIREQVRAFEYGLCALHHEPSYDAVCQSAEHFEGRKREKRVMM